MKNQKFKFTLSPQHGSAFKKTIVLIGMLLVITVSASYWLYSHFRLSTNDAYVQANIVQIAARVSGAVLHLPITNNQYVKKGQLLAELDPEPYQIATAAAKAQLASAQSNLRIAHLTATRDLALVSKHFYSPQQGDQALAMEQYAQAQVQVAAANLAATELHLNYTKLYAPASGWISNLTLREGDLLQEGQPIFALICDNEFWADANFRETDIAAIQVGQRAEIKIDMYPQHTFAGVVDSISGGSGTAFSLLPPENATGNWVKVSQRVPVRIHITDPDKRFPLRIGTSALATIHINTFVASPQPKAN